MHIVSDHEYDALAVVGFDHCLMETEDVMPLFVGKDQKHRWFCSAAVPRKEVIHPCLCWVIHVWS